VTVVWLVVPWTSSEVPLIAAIFPDVPGNGRDPPAPAPLPVPVVVEVDVCEAVFDADDDPPHAANVTAATPNADNASALRTGVERVSRRRALPTLVSDVLPSGLLMILPCFPLLRLTG
jgi:hypothetical protein